MTNSDESTVNTHHTDRRGITIILKGWTKPNTAKRNACKHAASSPQMMHHVESGGSPADPCSGRARARYHDGTGCCPLLTDLLGTLNVSHGAQPIELDYVSYPCCEEVPTSAQDVGNVVGSELNGSQLRDGSIFAQRSDRLLYVLGDSVARQMFAALLCSLERHAGRKPVRFGPPEPSQWHGWPPARVVAEYANGMRIAHSTLETLPGAPLGGRAALNAFATKVRCGMAGLAASLGGPDALRLVLVGGGAAFLGNHWSGGGGSGVHLAVPSCYSKARQTLAYDDNSSANPRCAHDYAALANLVTESVVLGLADHHAHGAGQKDAVQQASGAVTVVGTLPAHFGTVSGEFKSAAVVSKNDSRRQRCFPHTAARPREGSWRLSLLRNASAAHGVRYVDADEYMGGRYDGHVETRKHVAGWRQHVSRLDCLHWCMNARVWDGLIQRTFLLYDYEHDNSGRLRWHEGPGQVPSGLVSSRGTSQRTATKVAHARPAIEAAHHTHCV